VQELVFRTIYSCRNAEYQFLAKMLGNVTTLRPGEVKKASEIYAMPTSNFRAWEYWTARLEKSGNGVRAAGRGKKSIPAPRKRASVAKQKARKVKGRKR